MGVVKKNFNAEFKNMNFWINKFSGTVQIYPRVPLKKLYFKSHNSGKIGNTWKSHHKIFFDLINKFKKDNILEIGGGDNSFLNSTKNINLKITSIEVNPKTKSKNKNHTMIKGFFDSKTLRKFKLKKFQLIIHSHLFEHIYDINNFLSLVHKQLDDKGLHIFSSQHKNLFLIDANGMNFEHPYFLSEDLLDLF